MVDVIIWHEMAHTDGLDERQAQEREEELWKEFIGARLLFSERASVDRFDLSVTNPQTAEP